jgi:Tol biopolymer transport system component
LGGGSGQVAFASDRSGVPQIYLSNVDGTNVTPLTALENGACQPAWSPDGNLVVFISPCSKRADFFETEYIDSSLYLMNADRSNITQLTNVPGADFDPAWSPDGDRIAFASMRDGNKQIYTLDVASLAVTRLTRTESGIDTSHPSWSPDGTMIAYMVKRLNTYQVWVMDHTGQKNTQLVRSGQTLWDSGPIWSPDGSFILFSERRGSGFSPPWLMSVPYPVSADPRRLTQFPEPIEDIEYSPDGLWLISEGTDATGNRDIYYMTITAGNRTRLTNVDAIDFDPSWRPLQTP